VRRPRAPAAGTWTWPRNEPYKTHLAYVRERRSDADGDAILEEALANSAPSAASNPGAEAANNSVVRRCTTLYVARP